MLRIIISIEKNVIDKTNVIIYEIIIAKGQFPNKNSSRNGIPRINGKIIGPNWIAEKKDNIQDMIV